MKCEIQVRIIVKEPLSGVTLRVQKGRDELLPPTSESKVEAVFDFTVNVEFKDGAANFLGKFVHGPKGARFIYINSGKRAGQLDSPWDRRAKISLMSIGSEQIEKGLSSTDTRLEGTIIGVGGDGGPTCASTKLLGNGWSVQNVK